MLTTSGAGPAMPLGVAEKRGAGDGWTTPATFVKVPRATLCG